MRASLACPQLREQQQASNDTQWLEYVHDGGSSSSINWLQVLPAASSSRSTCLLPDLSHAACVNAFLCCSGCIMKGDAFSIIQQPSNTAHRSIQCSTWSEMHYMQMWDVCLLNCGPPQSQPGTATWTPRLTCLSSQLQLIRSYQATPAKHVCSCWM